MIALKDFFLSNGLHVVVNENHDVQTAVLDLIYKVGSRDDFQNNKGIAHLLEHLMFCGSENVKNFDVELQNVGGTNNAYTNLDVTNYYCSVPSRNIETAFWLESDRMFALTLSEESIEIQKNVVIEELKESYYGTPYSDFYLHLPSTIYASTHPYHFPTIGFESHIVNTTREDVLNFYNFYRPENAILVVSGNVDFEEIKKLSEKYFSRPSAKNFVQRNSFIKSENDVNKQGVEKIITKKLPLEGVFIVYKTCARVDENYFTTLVLSEMLDCGKASLLYSRLVEEKKFFSSVRVEFDNCELGGNLVISGFINRGIDIDFATNELLHELENFSDSITDNEFTKVKNNLKMGYFCDLLDLTTCTDIVANSFVVEDKWYINEYIPNVEKVKIEKIQYLTEKTFSRENKTVFKYKNS
ncbi:MAG: insulinase family protein [Cytophagales bacterium]|jgi:zinc protease|nr:insulinase family protein [Cytophagales bacterium]